MDQLLLRYRHLRWIAFAAFLGVAYGPLAGVLVGASGEVPAPLGELWSWRRTELLARSLLFSLAITAFTTVTGTLAAMAILRQWPRGARSLMWLLLATVALPPTVPALAWSYGFAALAPLTGGSMIGSWLVAALAQGMALLPFATGIGLVALGAVDQALLDVARSLVSPARLLFRIALPLARATIVAGAALVFLLSLLDYTIPSVFGINVYALEIFVAFSASHRVSDAFWLSLPLAVCALALVALVAGLPRRLVQTTGAPFPADGTLALPLQALLFLSALICAAALVAPLLSFVPAFADPVYLLRTVTTSWQETQYTLFTSATAALLALLLAIGPAMELCRNGAQARWLWPICLLPFLTPPALTGIGLIALWSPVRFIDVYGSPWMTVAAELARFTPVAIVVLSTCFLRCEPALIDAALVGGTSLRRIATRVLLPMARHGLAAAAGMAFVLSLGDIGANLLVTPPGSATLTMKAYNYLHYGGSQAAAGLCLLLLALAALGVVLPALLLKRSVTQT